MKWKEGENTDADPAMSWIECREDEPVQKKILELLSLMTLPPWKHWAVTYEITPHRHGNELRITVTSWWLMLWCKDLFTSLEMRDCVRSSLHENPKQRWGQLLLNNYRDGCLRCFKIEQKWTVTNNLMRRHMMSQEDAEELSAEVVKGQRNK